MSQKRNIDTNVAPLWAAFCVDDSQLVSGWGSRANAAKKGREHQLNTGHVIRIDQQQIEGLGFLKSNYLVAATINSRKQFKLKVLKKRHY